MLGHEVSEEDLKEICDEKALQDPDPFLVENVKLEEEIEDLNIIEKFDSQLESIFDPDNEVMESKVDPIDLESASDCFHGQSEKHSKKEIKVFSKKTKDKDGRTIHHCPEEGCEWKGKEKKRLEKHINKIHTPKEPKVFECAQCEYKAKRNIFLIRHMKVHEGPTKDQPLPCEKCGKMVTSKVMLTRHLALKHGMSNSNVPKNCTRCGQCKSIVEKDKLASHICIKKRKCKECGEMFYNENEKMKHFKAMHSELLPISNCEICGTIFRGFEASARLEKHLKVHTPVEIECPQCGKKVKGLENHIATMHTKNDEKRHKCSHCGKGFFRKPDLQKHIDSIHLDARKYPCRYGCSFIYKDFSNRNAHENKKHGGLYSRSDNSRIIDYGELC